MRGKPDIIRTLVFLFAAGLVITGFTTLQASEGKRADREEVPAIGFVQSADQALKR